MVTTEDPECMTYEQIKYEDDSYEYRQINYQADIDESTRIEPYCVIEKDVEIGKNCIIGPHNFIRNGTTIGDNCKIGGFNCFEGRNVYIGNTVRIGTHCNFGYGTTIEDFVFIAGHFTGANDNSISWYRKSFEPKPYTIKFGARVGLGVIFLPGVTAGKECFIGAGSLVTKDVQDYEIVYGHPARHRGYVGADDGIIVTSLI